MIDFSVTNIEIWLEEMKTCLVILEVYLGNSGTDMLIHIFQSFFFFYSFTKGRKKGGRETI